METLPSVAVGRSPTWARIDGALVQGNLYEIQSRYNHDTCLYFGADPVWDDRMVLKPLQRLLVPWDGTPIWGLSDAATGAFSILDRGAAPTSGGSGSGSGSGGTASSVTIAGQPVHVIVDSQPLAVAGIVDIASAQRTPSLVAVTTAGTVAAGATEISIGNTGSASGYVMGAPLPAGATVMFSTHGNDTLDALQYDATGTTFLIQSVA